MTTLKLHVISHGTRWSLKKEGKDRPILLAKHRIGCLIHGVSMLHMSPDKKGTIYVHNEDGTVLESWEVT